MTTVLAASKIFLGVLAVVFLANFFVPAQAGFRGYYCPENENIINITCQETCIMNHNSLYGWCGKRRNDYNCYCSPPLPVSTKPNMNGYQCADCNDSRYDVNCRVSCQCQFNAQSGYCDYKQRTCNCVGQAQDPTSTKFCPFDNIQMYLKYRSDLDLPGHPVATRRPPNDNDNYNN